MLSSSLSWSAACCAAPSPKAVGRMVSLWIARVKRSDSSVLWERYGAKRLQRSSDGMIMRPLVQGFMERVLLTQQFRLAPLLWRLKEFADRYACWFRFAQGKETHELISFSKGYVCLGGFDWRNRVSLAPYRYIYICDSNWTKTLSSGNLERCVDTSVIERLGRLLSHLFQAELC